MKCGDAAEALILHEHPDAQFLVRWQLPAIGPDQPTQLIGDMRKRNVRPNESHYQFERPECDVAALV